MYYVPHVISFNSYSSLADRGYKPHFRRWGNWGPERWSFWPWLLWQIWSGLGQELALWFSFKYTILPLTYYLLPVQRTQQLRNMFYTSQIKKQFLSFALCCLSNIRGCRGKHTLLYFINFNLVSPQTLIFKKMKSSSSYMFLLQSLLYVCLKISCETKMSSLNSNSAFIYNRLLNLAVLGHPICEIEISRWGPW